MKKNPVSSRFNNHSSKKQANRKNRALQLEALETRQLLSAASLMDCAEALYDVNDAGPYKVVTTPTFSVNCGNSQDGDIVALYVKGGDINKLAMKDASAQIVNSVQEEQIACLLVKMGANSTFTIDATGVSAENPITVFATRPGDQNADGVLSDYEANCVYGNVVRDGKSQASINLFIKKYHFDPRTLEFDPLLDINHDGKLSNEEFQNYGRAGFDKGQLDAIVSTTPQFTEMKIDGNAGTAVPGVENSYIINTTPGSEPAVSFTLPATETLKVNAKVEYTDANGAPQTIEKIVNPNGETNISIPLTGGLQAESTVNVTLNYDGLAESATTYTYTFDTTAPSLVPGLTLNKTEGAQNDYTATLTPNFNLNGLGGTDWTKAGAELEDPAQGIVLVLKDNGNDLKEITLKKEDLAALQAGTYKIDLTLTEGKHTITISARDLAGNLTAASSCAVTTDLQLPALSSNFVADYPEDKPVKKYVDNPEQTLQITVSDTNVWKSLEALTVTGTTITPTTDFTAEGKAVYTFSFTGENKLKYGENTFTFVATDLAGNKSETASYTYIYNEAPVVGDKGTKLNGANIKITKDSTVAINNKTNESVGTISGGKLNLGKVSDLFNEKDGSKIQADKDHVTIENLGSTVSSWEFDEDEKGEIILTLATFGTETKTFSAEDIKITYTDDYEKSASIEFDLAWTNDTAAPSATLEPNENLIEKEAENEYYYTGTENLDLTFTVTDFSAIKDNKVTINGTDYTIGADNKVTVTLASPVHNTPYEFKYTAEDEFGNKVENALICKITNDQKVDVESATIALDGTSQYDKEAAPTFKAQFTNLTEPATLILYCDGVESARATVASGETEKAITAGTLTDDGVYKYTAKLVDAAGNTFDVTGELTYYFDTTAPTVAITNTAEDPTGVTNNAYTLNLNTEDVTSGVASVKITQTYTDAQGITQTRTYESTTNFATCAVTLEYGENTFTYTATDKAGNTSGASNEFNVVYNVAPVATGVYYKEAEQKFVQTLSKSLCDENDKITLDLTKYFTDEAIAKLAISDGTVNITSTTTTAALTGAEISDGKLILQMTAGMEQGKPDRISNLAFTLKDEFGKTLNVSFDITYLFDSFAPKAEITTIKDATDKEITANDNGNYYLTGNAIKFDGKITDDTAIRSYGYKLVDANNVIVKDSAGNDITGTGSFEGDTTKEVALAFTTADTLTDGQYTLIVWGKDTLNPSNESTEDGTGAQAPQKIVFVIDNVTPVVTEKIAELYDSTGTVKAENQGLTNDNQPRVNYTVKITDANADTCKMSLYRFRSGGTIGSEVLIGTYDVEKVGDVYQFKGTITNEDALSDGTYRYTYVIQDAAGNILSTDNQLIKFTIDTTAPTLSVTNKAEEVFVAQNVDGKAKFDITASDANKLEKLEYTTDGGANWTELTLTDGAYTGTDVEFALTYGENTFQFRATDKAGNVTTSNEFTVDYDHIPAVTDETLVATPIVYDADKTEYTVQFTVKQISDLFVDKDCDNGDTLDYTCVFTGTESVVTDYDWEFNNGVWNLKLTVDPTELKKVHDVGTLVSITATDSYEQSATKTLNLAITKENLPPEQVKTDTLTDTQKLTNPSYTFDLTDYFADPESDTWSIETAKINNDDCSINGKEITWTPSSGKYGDTTVTLTVKDEFGAETNAEIAVTIDWAGVQGINVEDQTVSEDQNETPAQKSVTVTVDNAFDKAHAWGNYTATMTPSVSRESQNVSGYTVAEDHSQTKIDDMFSEYAFDGSQLTYTLNQYAYGDAVLKLKVNDVEKDVTITVTNVPCNPYAPDQTGGFTLSDKDAQEYNILDQCNTATDSGTLSLTSVNDGSTTVSIEKGGKTYTLNLVKTTDGFTLTRGTIGGQSGTDAEWEVLNGEKVEIPYTITNTRGEGDTSTASNKYTVTLNAIAKTYDVTKTRSAEEQQFDIGIDKLTSTEFQDKFEIDSVSGGSGSTASLVDGQIHIVIPATVYEDTSFDYVLVSKTDPSVKYGAKINLTITDDNLAPTVVDEPEFTLSEAEKSSYTWDVTSNFTHPVTGAVLTYALKADSTTVTDSRPGYTDTTFDIQVAENGQITLTPSDEYFWGTVKFTIIVSNQEIATSDPASIERELTLEVSKVNHAPSKTADAPETLTLSGKAGETFDVQTLKQYFEDVDGDEFTIANATEVTKFPEELGISTIQVTLTDNDADDPKSATFDVALHTSAAASRVVDQSINTSQTYGATDELTSSVTITSDITTTTTAGKMVTGSVVKKGSTLAEGTRFYEGFVYSGDLDTFLDGLAVKDINGNTGNLTKDVEGETVYSVELDGKEMSFTVQEDGKTIEAYGQLKKNNYVMLAESVTLDGDLTVARGSDYTDDGTLELGMGSTIVKNSTFAVYNDYASVFGADYADEYGAPDMDRIIELYNTRRDSEKKVHDVMLAAELDVTLSEDAITLLNGLITSGTLVTTDIETFVYSNKVGSTETKSVYVVGTSDNNFTPFQYVSYDQTTNKLTGWYRPFDTPQVRTAYDMKIDALDVNVTLTISYETPFTVTYGIVEGTDAASSEKSMASKAVMDTSKFVKVSDLESGKQYTFEMWLTVNLPTACNNAVREKWFTTNWANISALELSDITAVKVEKEGKMVDLASDNCKYEDGTLTMENTSITLKESGLFADIFKGYTYFAFTAGNNVTLGTITNEAKTSTLGLTTREDKCGVGTDESIYGETYTVLDSSQIIFNSSYLATAVRGTSAAKETVVEGNGVYMSLVKEKSATEKTSELTKSDAYVTEWDSSYLELWVNTREAGTDIANFKFDVNYDSSILYAAGVEYSSNVKNAKAASFDDKNGSVIGISADLTDAVTNEDGFVLVGRVKFTPVENGGVAADTINSTSLGISLANIELRNSDGLWLDVNTQAVVSTKAFAVVYDANDDGQVNISDLVAFARHFGANTVDTTDPAIWALDFNNNGSVDITDLVAFARNYSASYKSCVNEGGKVQYPANFFQTWIGTTLEMSGDSNVSDTLDDALNAWSEKLGEELNLDVQIIVKEYENVEGGVLGETILLGCGEDGKPNEAVIYLDSDALGMGWYVGESDDVQDEQYDLYSVLLHELGHAVGLTEAYDGFESIIHDGVFTDAEGNRHVVFASHVYGETDLMNDSINVGTRSEISGLDVELAKTARENGTTVTQRLSNSITGATANVSEMNVIAVSGIMPKAEFTEILTKAATKAVLEAAARNTDRAWEYLADDETPKVNPVAVATASELDELFEDEDFASDLNQIVRETLDFEL